MKKIIVIGCSSGGLKALSYCIGNLPENYLWPIIVVQHRRKYENAMLEEVLQTKTNLKIKQADEKDLIKSSSVYVAPPDYHLLLEPDMTLSLSSDHLVNYSRPSIDVLFESAAIACGPSLIGILLTGANKDGAAGIKQIRKLGGTTIAQDPRTAECPYMPQAAIETGHVQHVMDLSQINSFLIEQNAKV